MADVAGNEIGDALTALWGQCAPATWNRNRAAVSSWLTWCAAKKKWVAPSVLADAERRRENVDHTKAVARTKLERLLSRRDIPLRDRRSGRQPDPSSLASSASTSTLMTPKKLMLSLRQGEVWVRISSGTWRPWARDLTTQPSPSVVRI
ncbi:hypothetical protein [Actinomadura sp. 6N118]|uniref:hypothetical protein n=1 Tax=Actinomadura sp. 6N118 TaxID=3375151 RepID=UPI00379A35F1